MACSNWASLRPNFILSSNSLKNFYKFRLFHSSCNLKSSSSSNQWLERRKKDLFTKQAGKENFRCRSAFKLQQIDSKYKILKPGFVVVDCGASPGSWSQVAVQKVNSLNKDPSRPTGVVIGIDLQHIAPVDGALMLGGLDFTSPATQEKVKELLKSRDSKVDVVLSDMAPKATGLRSHNHDIIIELCFSALRFCLPTLRPGGTFVCKIWSGSGQQKLTKAMESVFEQVNAVKPKASYDDSAELFLLGRGFKFRKQ